MNVCNKLIRFILVWLKFCWDIASKTEFFRSHWLSPVDKRNERGRVRKNDAYITTYFVTSNFGRKLIAIFSAILEFPTKFISLINFFMLENHPYTVCSKKKFPWRCFLFVLRFAWRSRISKHEISCMTFKGNKTIFEVLHWKIMRTQSQMP